MKDKKETFKILKTGNFFLPIRDIGREFNVLDTFDIEIKNKKMIESLQNLEQLNKKGPSTQIFFKNYADIFWNMIKKEKLDKEYKNCWIVPVKLDYSIKNDWASVSFDILKSVKNKNKKKIRI